MQVPDNYLSIGKVPAYGTFQYSGILTGSDGKTPFPAGALQTLTLTISDCATGLIINNRNQTNVLNANGVVVDVTGTTGAITWTPLPADNPIINPNPSISDGSTETHEAILQWTWIGDDMLPRQQQRKIFITVERYAPTETPIQPGVGTSAVTVVLGAPDVQVWITSDALGANRVAGTLTTNKNGQATFYLVAGTTYYIWTDSENFAPLQGTPFIAVAD